MMRETVIDVAERYIGPTKPSGEFNVLVNCPFHEAGAGRHNWTLSISTVNGRWICFSCGVGGGLPTLLKALQIPASIRDHIIGPVRDELRRRVPTETRSKDLFVTSTPLPEAVLGVYEYCPMDLVSAGFSEDLLYKYDVGFDHRLSKVTWPIRDINGQLAGIYGRNRHGGFPKYKAYELKDYDKEVQRLVPRYKFQKSRFCWNMDRVHARLYAGASGEDVIVVEGFKAGLWCVQCGFPNVVAIFGNLISADQAAFLRRLGARVVLFLDNNFAGMIGALRTYDILYRSLQVMFPFYPDEREQPDDLEPDEIHGVLQDPITRAQWLKFPVHQPAWEEWKKRKENYRDGKFSTLRRP